MPKTEFLLACIATDPESVGEYIAEGKRMGISVNAPDINHSDVDITIHGTEIWYGLSNILGVGKDAARYTVKLRQELGHIKSRNHLDGALEDAVIFWELRDGKKGKSPKQKLGSGAIDAMEQAGCFDGLAGCGSAGLPERAAFQRKLLGISFVDVYSPLTEQYSSDIVGCVPVSEIPKGQQLVDCYGLLSAVDMRRTRKDAKAGFADKEYAVLTFEWQQQTYKVTCFHDQWQQLLEDMTENSFWRLHLSVNGRGASLKAGRLLV